MNKRSLLTSKWISESFLYRLEWILPEKKCAEAFFHKMTPTILTLTQKKLSSLWCFLLWNFNKIRFERFSRRTFASKCSNADGHDSSYNVHPSTEARVHGHRATHKIVSWARAPSTAAPRTFLHFRLCTVSNQIRRKIHNAELALALLGHPAHRFCIKFLQDLEHYRRCCFDIYDFERTSLPFNCTSKLLRNNNMSSKKNRIFRWISKLLTLVTY